MDFSSVCRTCLSDSNLKPIFVNSEDHKRYSSAVYITTGIKVTITDGLPQNMCTNCIEYLNTSMKFRKKCIDTQTQLLKIKNQLVNENNSNIHKDTLREESKQLLTLENDNSENTDSIADRKGIKLIDVRIEHDRVLKTDNEEIDLNTEYVFDSIDEDDKPLKYLIEETLNEEDNIIVFGDAVEENNGKVDKLEEKAPRGRVSCQLCQKDLSVRSIDAHMARSHPGADERKVKCEVCDTYVLKEKLNRHWLLVHGSGRTFRCGYCKCEFESKDVLVEHVKTCSAKKKKRKVAESSRELSECDICNKRMQRASLRMHRAIIHKGLGPVCEHCGGVFGNKLRLSEHYRAKHGYDKFQCTRCEFQSASTMAMRNHERRHLGEKPFVCEQCGAKFHAAYLLAQHTQSHRTHRQVMCDLCPASFKARNSLHMHKITCHSKSLYKCTMCSRAYSCRHYAVKHIRHVHDYRGPVPPLQRVAKEEGA